MTVATCIVYVLPSTLLSGMPVLQAFAVSVRLCVTATVQPDATVGTRAGGATPFVGV